MRTTITLDDKAFNFAPKYAAARALRLGKAVSELILMADEKTVPKSVEPRKLNGVWVSDLPESAPILKSSDVRSFLDDAA